jgi:hypothetical protein
MRTKAELESFAKQASAKFINNGVSLDEAVFEVASVNSLNDEQTKRVIGYTNTFVNNELVKQAKAHGKDPSIHFPMASAEGVKTASKKIGGHAKTASKKSDAEFDIFGSDPVEKVASMFEVPEAEMSNEEVMTKVAGAASTAPTLSHLDENVLTEAYIKGTTLQGHYFLPSQMEAAARNVQTTMEFAKQAQAGLDHEIELGLAALKDTVHDLMLDGTTIASLKHIAATENMSKTASAVIHDVNIEQGIDVERMGEGKNQVEAGAIIDPRHPFIRDLRKVAALRLKQEKTAQVVAQLEDAHARAQADVKECRRLPKTAMFMPTKAVGSKAGLALNAVGAGFSASDATKKLKAAQRTPAVGAQKMASVLGSAAAAVLPAVAVGTGIALAGRGIDAGLTQIGKAWKSQKHQKMFAELAKKDPEFLTNPRAREAFDIIEKYAPAILKSPVATRDYIKGQLQFPRSSMELIRHLADFQKTYAQGNMGGGPGMGSMVAGEFNSQLKSQAADERRRLSGG